MAKKKKTTTKKNSNKNWIQKHKTLSGIIILLILITGTLYITGGIHSVLAKTYYTIGIDNTQEIKNTCLNACKKENTKTYCETIQKIRYGEETRATFLKSTSEPNRWKEVYTYTTKLNGTCDNIAKGYKKALNKEGKEQEFSISFPYTEFERCDKITCE